MHTAVAAAIHKAPVTHPGDLAGLVIGVLLFLAMWAWGTHSERKRRARDADHV